MVKYLNGPMATIPYPKQADTRQLEIVSPESKAFLPHDLNEPFVFRTLLYINRSILAHH